ncbi:carbapenem antibiotics biosynthesis protein carD [Paracoccidioides lutzii Pb01]|uniref:Proline dehydrogenase n=1 Tax=Paracoccidioides lutzii (strain ATCC MYA-826 / Pb01) TaxID=502779 RepID=C1H7N6_PARBA|nr:carbapenem antibiotics biosynthesis protein carD [Paracoccidioides lutzii Pb01]EEH36359.1 carbapenem antibiotics biosynthesis protein carD [Paracoccidioides lutzii Pb01]
MRRQVAFKTTSACFGYAGPRTPARRAFSWNQYPVRHSHHEPGQLSDHSLPAAGGSSTSPPGSTRPYATLNHTMPSSNTPKSSPLSILPLSTILRSLFVTTISSSPLLFPPSLAFLTILAKPESTFLNPDNNLLLKTLLGHTMYAQFCAGETRAEVKGNIKELKKIGFSGVILGYAREVTMDETEIQSLAQATVTKEREEDMAQGIADLTAWKEGTLETVDLADDGDFVALKFTGAGKGSVRHLLHGLPPSSELEEAIVEICERAKARNVRLLIDAEQQAVQPAIDKWALDFQRRYNKGPNQRAIVYSTYQAYLRSAPKTLSEHLAIAKAEGFVLGVKLVRGAYLGTEPRHLIWATKEDTDKVYDGIAESLIKQQYGEILSPHHHPSTVAGSSNSSGQSNHHSNTFPKVNLVLASHNRASVDRAQKIRNEQLRLTGTEQIEMAYGQLSGMADDISCELVQAGKAAREQQAEGVMAEVEAPKAYKYLVWGTVGECTRYLLRRAQENRDAASRTEETRRAMAKELRRRLVGGR